MGGAREGRQSEFGGGGGEGRKKMGVGIADVAKY